MSELLQYKCPSCGGAIEFDSKSQKMKCPFCDTEFDIETLRSYDDNLKNAGEAEMNWDTPAGTEWDEGEEDGMTVYVCDSCGGEIVGDANTAATTCPFCGNRVVVSGKLSGALKPDYVIPFKLDKEAAKAALIRHTSGKRLLPKIFRDQNHIDEIKGIYVPFWLFSADADAKINYRATKTRVWSDKKYNYIETSHFSLRREGTLGFERVPVDGSSKLEDDLMESIEPFDFKDAVDFKTAYLAGYFADKYDVSAQDTIESANQRIKRSVEQTFAQTTAGYGSVIPESTSVNLSNSKSDYALFPVWLLSTTFSGKHYLFAMNGQTGKFVGDLPCDRGRFWAWLLGLTGGIALILYILMRLFILL